MPYYGYGYYGGYGDFLANNIYVLLLIPVLLFAFWAQMQVSGNFRRYNAVNNRRRLTGAQAAEAVLSANGVYDVAIRRCRGSLTDHYDPGANIIRLSAEVYNSSSTAAVGVACHEAGHAVQYAQDYAPVKLRAAIVPITNIGAKLSWPLIFAGLLLCSFAPRLIVLAYIGVGCYVLCAVFQIVTLPAEFNASRRAMDTIESMGILSGDELTGAGRVLRAAALTYVAALAVTLMQILRLLLIVGNRDRNN